MPHETKKNNELTKENSTKNTDSWGLLRPQVYKSSGYSYGQKIGKYGTYFGERGFYDTRNELNELTGKEWAKFTKSWFILNPAPRRKKEIFHPAKFPEDLIADFIKFFTKKDELILDPMAGTGSTLVACDMTKRKGFGIELGQKWFDIANGRTSQTIILGDARQLDIHLRNAGISSVDFCITSPPYWNMLHKTRGNVKSAAHIRKEEGLDETYGHNELDLGNIDDYEKYLTLLTEVYNKVYDYLRNKRYLVVIVQNILTQEGEMIPVAWDIAKKLSRKYVLKQERIWLQDNKMLGIWGYPNRYVSNVHHHYCLIFEKNVDLRSN